MYEGREGPIGTRQWRFRAARFNAGAPALYCPAWGGPERPARPCGSARLGFPGRESARTTPRGPAPFFKKPAPRPKIPMSEDERQELVGTIVEAHAGLKEVAFRLRRR